MDRTRTAGDKPIIADHYGNNTAVICKACARPFIVSTLLDREYGKRTCPHCEMYTVKLTDLMR